MELLIQAGFQKYLTRLDNLVKHVEEKIATTDFRALFIEALDDGWLGFDWITHRLLRVVTVAQNVRIYEALHRRLREQDLYQLKVRICRQTGGISLWAARTSVSPDYFGWVLRPAPRVDEFECTPSKM